jgi:hypothetical protein
VLPAIAASRNGRLVSIASRDLDRARAMALQHAITKVARGAAKVLADRDVGAVYIPLVNSQHKEWTGSAGRQQSVLLKELGLNAEEAAVMADASGAQPVLMEAFMHPSIRACAFVEGLRGVEGRCDKLWFSAEHPPTAPPARARWRCAARRRLLR